MGWEGPNRRRDTGQTGGGEDARSASICRTPSNDVSTLLSHRVHATCLVQPGSKKKQKKHGGVFHCKTKKKFSLMFHHIFRHSGDSNRRMERVRVCEKKKVTKPDTRERNGPVRRGHNKANQIRDKSVRKSQIVIHCRLTESERNCDRNRLEQTTSWENTAQRFDCVSLVILQILFEQNNQPLHIGLKSGGMFR